MKVVGECESGLQSSNGMEKCHRICSGVACNQSVMTCAWQYPDTRVEAASLVNIKHCEQVPHIFGSLKSNTLMAQNHNIKPWVSTLVSLHHEIRAISGEAM